MTKILAKIARRNNSNELPGRRELVEMDLFDTDRNPWPGELGGKSLWIRNDYDVVVPFSPGVADGVVLGEESVGPVDLVVERTSFAVAFVGGIFNVASGAGDGKSVSLQIQADNTMIANGVSAHAEQTFLVNGPGYRTPDYNSFGYAVLNPGTYQVRVWAWKNDSVPVISFTELAATIALLPAGLAAVSGWGGTGG